MDKKAFSHHLDNPKFRNLPISYLINTAYQLKELATGKLVARLQLYLHAIPNNKGEYGEKIAGEEDY
ncbi:MAG: hypothetical protein ACE5OZ_19430 [Candidatus Heimdallarchaeota archaeon]